MVARSFTPAVVPPPPLTTSQFALAPLGPEHNERDHAAWTSSIEHIRSSAGFAPGDWGDDGWPVSMTLDENRGDLEMHADEFRRGAAFAYAVLDPASAEVIGCVYIDPDLSGGEEAIVRCWVRADVADLDDPLARAVRDWIDDEWPLTSARFPGRVGSGP